jgi:predicted metal-dependent phosphoesterase TrpH
MLIDLHVHSHLSKGCELNPRLVLERSATLGLDGVAFTETNTQDGFEELLDLARATPLKVFVGLELVTDKGQYLCFFPRPELAPEPVQMWGSNRERPWSAGECIPKLKSLGAAIVAARPYDRDFQYPAGDFILTLQGLSAVEGFNPKVRQTANELAMEAAESLRLPCVAGSDARSSLDELGRAATLFKAQVSSQQDFVDALLEGNFWAVMMGELPKLTRPGEAREAEPRKEGRRRRKGNRPGRPGSWN